MFRILNALLLGLILTGSACTQRRLPVETTLYFGLSIPGGGVVTDSSWLRFEQEEIIRAFPKGFTVIQGNGIWKGRNGLVSENTRVVVVLNNMSDSLSAQIDSLREKYKASFRQESVMRVDQTVERWDF